MKLIKPSFEIIESTRYTIDDIYKSIELAGKVSHKSEHTIKEGSAKDFVDRMIKLGHGATLEFGTVYLYINYHDPSFNKFINKYSYNSYSICIDTATDAYITTNYRVLVENNWLDDLKYLCEPTEYHEKRICVKFVCDRGILAEFTRHRTFSFMAESSRYCNYSKGKFNNELTFIEPCWSINMDMFKEDPGITAEYTYDYTEQEKNISASAILFEQLERAEKSYLELIERGWKPEQTRNVLPLALKTELYMCGYAEDWRHFFFLRTPTNAHPQARELAIPLQEEFIKREYI